MSVIVKAELGGLLRLLELSDSSFHELRAATRSAFGIDQKADVALQYMDDEGDWICMDNDKDFQLGLRIVRPPMRVRLRLATPSVVSEGSSKAETLRPVAVNVVEAHPVTVLDSVNIPVAVSSSACSVSAEAVANTSTPYTIAARRLKGRGVEISAETLRGLMDLLRLVPKRFIKSGLVTREELESDGAPITEEEDDDDDDPILRLAEDKTDDSNTQFAPVAPPSPVMNALHSRGINISPQVLHSLMSELRIRPKKFVKAGLVPKHIIKAWNQIRNTSQNAKLDNPVPTSSWHHHHHHFHAPPHGRGFHHHLHHPHHRFFHRHRPHAPRPPPDFYAHPRSFMSRPSPITHPYVDYEPLIPPSPPPGLVDIPFEAVIETRDGEEARWSDHPATHSQGRSSNRLKVRFVEHVTLPDKTRIQPGAEIVKVWRVRNDHPDPWPAVVQLIPIGTSASEFCDITSSNVPGGVQQGETVEISVTLKAPRSEGMYEAFFRLCDARPGGKKFGQRLWLSVIVSEDLISSAPLPMWNDEDTLSLPVPMWMRMHEGADERTSEDTLQMLRNVVMGAFDDDDGEETFSEAMSRLCGT